MIGLMIKEIAGQVIGRYQARKKAKQAAAARIEEKRADLEVSRIDAEIRRQDRTDTADIDYDIQVLRNRERSWADEILIAVFLTLFVLPFVGPRYAAVVEAGWKAHGYVDGAPWWFEFAIVGILVSTLGLFRLLRIWFGKRPIAAKEAARTES